MEYLANLRSSVNEQMQFRTFPKLYRAFKRVTGQSSKAGSLNFQLFRRINPDFRFAFVHLDSSGGFHLFTFDVGDDGRF